MLHVCVSKNFSEKKLCPQHASEVSVLVSYKLCDSFGKPLAYCWKEAHCVSEREAGTWSLDSGCRLYWCVCVCTCKPGDHRKKRGTSQKQDEQTNTEVFLRLVSTIMSVIHLRYKRTWFLEVTWPDNLVFCWANSHSPCTF